MLLLALVLVAMLAQTVLRHYGLLAPAEVTAAAARGPTAVAPAELDPAAPAPPPRNALERARGVESSMRQQAEDLGRKIDDAAK